MGKKIIKASVGIIYQTNMASLGKPGDRIYWSSGTANYLGGAGILAGIIDYTWQGIALRNFKGQVSIFNLSHTYGQLLWEVWGLNEGPPTQRLAWSSGPWNAPTHQITLPVHAWYADHPVTLPQVLFELSDDGHEGAFMLSLSPSWYSSTREAFSYVRLVLDGREARMVEHDGWDMNIKYKLDGVEVQLVHGYLIGTTAGTHTLSAELEGYSSASATFNLGVDVPRLSMNILSPPPPQCWLQMFIVGKGATDPAYTGQGNHYTYPEGTQVTLTASPSPGSHFVKWTDYYITENFLSSANPYLLTMERSHSVTAWFDYDVAPPEGKIWGVVLNADGTPCVGATVKCTNSPSTLTTDGYGQYGILGPWNVPIGAQTVTATYGALSGSANVTAVEGQVVKVPTIVLKAEGGVGYVRGYVKSTDGNHPPLSGATVRVQGNIQYTTTDATGFYELTLNPGSYTLEAAKSGYQVDPLQPNTADVYIASGQTTDARDMFLAKIVVTEYGTLSCSATMDGLGVSADVTGEGMDPKQTPFDVVLGSGFYTLTATYQSKTQTKTVYVPANGTVEVTFAFTSGGGGGGPNWLAIILGIGIVLVGVVALKGEPERQHR